MKKQWVLFLLLWLMSAPYTFSNDLPSDKTLMCMRNLPQVIVVDSDSQEMNFTKSLRVDSFWNYEEKQLGGGYAQSYQNGSCFATVSYYTRNAGRLSNNKVKREIKSVTQFHQTSQNSKRIKAVHFYTVIGREDDQINVLMLGSYKDRFLKIRTTCQYLPRMQIEDYENQVVKITQKLAREVVMDMNACFSSKKE